MPLEPDKISAESFKSSAIRMLGLFVVTSVFNPLIFSLIDEYVPEQSRAIVYWMFNVIYGLLPLLILILIWVFNDQFSGLYGKKLKRLAYLFFPGLALYAFILFSTDIGYHTHLIVYGLGFYVLSILRSYWMGKSKIGSEWKTIAYCFGGTITILGLYTLILFGQNHDSLVGYQDSFDSLSELSNAQSDLAEAEDEVVKTRYLFSLDTVGIAEKAGVLFTQQAKVIHFTRSASSKFKQLFKQVRSRELILAMTICMLLIVFTAFWEVKLKNQKPFMYSGRVVLFTYALLIFNLLQPVSTSPVSAQRSGFMYFVGNWYLPSSINSVVNTTYSNSTEQTYNTSNTVNSNIYNKYLGGNPYKIDTFRIDSLTTVITLPVSINQFYLGDSVFVEFPTGEIIQIIKDNRAFLETIQNLVSNQNPTLNGTNQKVKDLYQEEE